MMPPGHGFARFGRELLQQLALLATQFRRHGDVDDDVQVTAGAGPSQVRHALAPKPDLGARLHAGSQLYLFLAFDRGNVDSSSEGRLRDRDIQIVVELGPLSAESWVRSHVHRNVQTSRRAATGTRLALAG